MGKMLKGLAVGTIVGAAVGMMVFPELDRKKQRALRKTAKRMSGMAEDFYGDMMYKMK
ncbi:MAG: YtxH domain-containing protein [Clostridium sp.]